jgi:hypothetical protein
MSAVASTVGRFVWHEQVSSDPKQAQNFYTQLFGWDTEAFKPGEVDYTMISSGGQNHGGFGKAMEGAPPPHWLSHVGVENLHETCTCQTNLPTDVPTPVICSTSLWVSVVHASGTSSVPTSKTPAEAGNHRSCLDSDARWRRVCRSDPPRHSPPGSTSLDGFAADVLPLSGRGEGGVDSRPTFSRVLDDVPASVDGVAATTENQVLAFEVAQQTDQLRGLDAYAVGRAPAGSSAPELMSTCRCRGVSSTGLTRAREYQESRCSASLLVGRGRAPR